MNKKSTTIMADAGALQCRHVGTPSFAISITGTATAMEKSDVQGDEVYVHLEDLNKLDCTFSWPTLNSLEKLIISALMAPLEDLAAKIVFDIIKAALGDLKFGIFKPPTTYLKTYNWSLFKFSDSAGEEVWELLTPESGSPLLIEDLIDLCDEIVQLGLANSDNGIVSNRGYRAIDF